MTGNSDNGRVCFAWENNDCHWWNTISVTHCGSFHVYQLTIPPICSARYCTGTPAIQSKSSISSQSFRDIHDEILLATTPSSVLPSQCSNYTTIDDPTRNVNEDRGNNNDRDHFTSGPIWVRFVGTGGTQIPTSAAAMYRCGTSVAGWYSGEMPTVPSTTVSGNVCYTWVSGNCSYRTKISVTNCGSYYVYHLNSPLSGGLRYCTTN